MTTKRAIKKTTRPTLKRALAYIDAILARGDKTAVNLWAVLSALRGPSIGDGGEKDNTTAFIRTAAFPRAAKSKRFAVPSFDRAGTHIRVSRETNWHFRNHIEEAAEALGLKVEIIE